MRADLPKNFEADTAEQRICASLHARTRTPHSPHSPHSPLTAPSAPTTQPSMALTRALVRLHTRVVSGAIYAFNVAALVACLAAAVAEDALRSRLDRRQMRGVRQPSMQQVADRLCAAVLPLPPPTPPHQRRAA